MTVNAPQRHYRSPPRPSIAFPIEPRGKTHSAMRPATTRQKGALHAVATSARRSILTLPDQRRRLRRGPKLPMRPRGQSLCCG